MLNTAKTRGWLLSRALARRGVATTNPHDSTIRLQLLNELRTVGLTSKEGETILTTYPNYVDENSLNRFKNCFMNLTTIMPRTEAKNLLYKMPFIAFQNFREIEKINDYLVNNMGIEYDEFIKSDVFSHSLEHLKTRHQFLFRCGLYEQPNYDGTTREIQNPPLKKIVDTSDTVFVKQTGLELQEYKTFRNVLQVEMEMDDELELDDDGDEVDDSLYRYSEEGEQLYKRKELQPLPKGQKGKKGRKGKR